MSEQNKREHQRQIIFCVEKFIPTRCPKPGCGQAFAKNGKDGYLLATYWLHETREESDAILKSIRCPGLYADLIVCGKCHNVTLRVMVEERKYEKREDAERAVAEEGFANLGTGQAVGNMCIKGVRIHRSLPPNLDGRYDVEITS